MLRTELQETFVVEDCVVYMTGDTDTTNNFGNNATILSNSNSTIIHDSTNKYFVTTKTISNGLVLLPLTALTGLSDIILEFDMYIPSQSVACNGGGGISNIGFYQLGGQNASQTSNIYYNGDHLSGSGHYDNEWIHHKFVISSNEVLWTAKRQDDSEIINRTQSVSISSNTQIGLSIGYSTNAIAYFKNIKVKAL